MSSTDVSAAKHRLLSAIVLLGAVAATTAGAQPAPCSAPVTPTIPDGARASMQEMIAGQQAVKTFQAANMDYMHCLEKRFSAARRNVDRSADAAGRALAEADYARAVNAYNAAVSAEEEVAGLFNIELREFKASRR